MKWKFVKLNPNQHHLINILATWWCCEPAFFLRLRGAEQTECEDCENNHVLKAPGLPLHEGGSAFSSPKWRITLTVMVHHLVWLTPETCLRSHSWAKYSHLSACILSRKAFMLPKGIIFYYSLFMHFKWILAIFKWLFFLTPAVFMHFFPLLARTLQSIINLRKLII